MQIKYTDHIPIGNYNDTTVFYDEEAGVLLHGQQVGYKKRYSKRQRMFIFFISIVLTGVIILLVLSNQHHFTRSLGTLFTAYVLALPLGLLTIFPYRKIRLDVNLLSLTPEDYQDYRLFLETAKKNVRTLYLITLTFQLQTVYGSFMYINTGKVIYLLVASLSLPMTMFLSSIRVNKRRKVIDKLLKEMQA